jgi:eukaryotic-like serine/threonine-protein kinase
VTPERWKQVERLYHEARSRPAGERAAFLADACPDDEALRRDVESLLNESVSEDGFLAGPALVAAAQIASDLAPAAMSGRSLGGYELQALVGAGGMGEVYRARDAKLGRDVAIKILPRAFTNDPDRLARFEREARMLAALHHPNICAIFGLEEAEGIRFLILEFVEGATLADTLADVSRLQSRGRGLPLPDTLTIARQIAEALDVAHAKGIIHRDLKPANVKITPQGVVKLLDFGLAKIADGDPAALDLTQAPGLTHAGGRQGAVMGTASYMSPEQSRGLAVDKRTDIWSFGCVLYEMLTGRATFAGDTISDTIAKILEREPDWSALPAATPTSVRRLLLRCLAKDAKQRLRDIGDVRIELDASGDVQPDTSEAAVAPPVAARRRTPWLPWAALAVLAVAIGVRDASRPVPTPENPLANAQFTRFTDWEGTEGGAEISPDGRFVAFLADPGGSFGLWQSQVGTGRFVNLTPDRPLYGPATLMRHFGFSEDGAEIWLSSSGGATSRKMLMPLTGGTSRPFLAEGAAAPAFSPDGTRLAYVTVSERGDDSLWVADGSGADAREIVSAREKMHNHNPVWSPDSQWIYFVRGLDPTDAMDVWRVRPAGGPPERMTQQRAAVSFVAPLGLRTLLYVARAGDWSGPWLWALDLESKTARRASVGLEQYSSVAASRDGRRVVATVANPTASLWRVPLGGRVADERDAEPYRVPTVRALAPRFGGTSLFHLSTSGVGDGLWRVQDGRSVLVRKGADPPLFEPPAVSRDGGRVAIVLRRDGRRRLGIMAADGSDARTLASSIDVRGTPDWSPDGRWIATGGSDAQEQGLFKIPVDGGTPVRLVSGEAFNPAWSPRGDLIVYAAEVGGNVPLLGVRPDGGAVELPSERVRPGGYRFLPDGTGLVYLPHPLLPDFWLLDLATKKARRLTHLSYRGALRDFDITPDGKHIVFDRSLENSNIVLIDLPR